MKAAGGMKKQEHIHKGGDNRNGRSNFRIFEEAAQNDKQKIGQIEVGFDITIDDKRQSQDDGVQNNDRIIEGRRQKAIFAEEVQSNIRCDVSENECMKKRLRDNVGGRVKEQIRTDDDDRPADKDHARLDRHAQTNCELR